MESFCTTLFETFLYHVIEVKLELGHMIKSPTFVPKQDLVFEKTQAT